MYLRYDTITLHTSLQKNPCYPIYYLIHITTLHIDDYIHNCPYFIHTEPVLEISHLLNVLYRPLQAKVTTGIL